MRRFPAPWTVEALHGDYKIVDANGETVAGFKIVDANGQALAYVYARADERATQIAKCLTVDEARRIASNIAKLPVLLGYARPDGSLAVDSNLSDERHEAEDTTP